MIENQFHSYDTLSEYFRKNKEVIGLRRFKIKRAKRETENKLIIRERKKITIVSSFQ